MAKSKKNKGKNKASAKLPAGKKTRTRKESAHPDFARGMEVRRAMWGADGADKQIDAAGDFIWPLQEVVTKYCFGQTWTRPKLSRKIRSMITLAMLVAMARPNELKVHVQGAIANGVTKDEIQEILLHAMVYAGVPRGVEGFRATEEKLKELGLE
ncbi:MAG: carboxymuconolactone decarboxylase family protein [Pseudorhodoplanes sp.]|uniref:carboxymuconolactone decarboxylase family protein n=1 Tax=Pseudorhodoplanes sp. TaxID=1934341 RepID=UPI003D0BC138